MYSVKNTTLVDLGYYLTVEGVLKAIFTNLFFEQYGMDGVATLDASEGVNLDTIIDDLVIIECEKMEQSNSKYKCNTKAVDFP